MAEIEIKSTPQIVVTFNTEELAYIVGALGRVFNLPQGMHDVLNQLLDVSEKYSGQLWEQTYNDVTFSG